MAPSGKSIPVLRVTSESSLSETSAPFSSRSSPNSRQALRQMHEVGRPETEIKEERRSFNEEIRAYKEESIRQMLELHPEFYEPIIDFHDWRSGMKYLEDNKDFIINLFGTKRND